MDSVTQIALGGAVGALVGGKKYGRKSVFVGAICGTIPDLDTFFLGDSDPITQLTYHRGFSHSFLFAVLVTPVLAWLFSKMKMLDIAFKDRKLHLLIFLSLLTHMLLDSLTIYGTQLLWPLEIPPIGLGSVFIIDPLYTLPVLVGLAWFLAYKSTKAITLVLIISTLYLAWGVAAQQYTHSLVKKSYQAPYTHVLVQATPFNSFLWRILVMKENGYEVGYYSVFDKNKTIGFKNYNSKPSLLEDIEDSDAVQRLKWFTKGFYKAKLRDQDVIMIDLRMGYEPHDYFFGFIVGEKENRKINPVEPKRHSRMRALSEFSNIWARIWDEEVEL